MPATPIFSTSWPGAFLADSVASGVLFFIGHDKAVGHTSPPGQKHGRGIEKAEGCFDTVCDLPETGNECRSLVMTSVSSHGWLEMQNHRLQPRPTESASAF